MVIRICAAPGAARLVHAVAFEGIRAAMSEDTRWLLRQMLRRKNNQGFQCDLMRYMFAIADLTYIPLLLSHTAPPDYMVIV
jgi:hypothetical protein